MKPVIRAIGLGLLIFVFLTGALLIVVNSSMSVKMSCIKVSDDLFSCDYSRWEFFRIIYTTASLIVSVLVGIIYWKKCKRK